MSAIDSPSDSRKAFEEGDDEIVRAIAVDLLPYAFTRLAPHKEESEELPKYLAEVMERWVDILRTPPEEVPFSRKDEEDVPSH
jgi:hypothetical protein